MTFLGSRTKNFYATVYDLAYAALLVAALMFLRLDVYTDALSFIQQTFVFFLGFFVVFHAWWRTGSLLTKSAKNSLGTFNRLIFLRFVVLAYGVLLLQTFDVAASSFVNNFAYFSSFLTAQLLIGVFPFFIVMSPSYGKERVMIRRELLTEIFFMISFLALTLTAIFEPAIFSLLWLYPAFGALLFVCRPLAKVFTKWKELEPPHRGGRTRRENARQRRVETSGRSGRVIASRPPRRSAPDRQKREQRSERPAATQSSRPKAPASRRISAKDPSGTRKRSNSASSGAERKERSSERGRDQSARSASNDRARSSRNGEKRAPRPRRSSSPKPAPSEVNSETKKAVNTPVPEIKESKENPDSPVDQNATANSGTQFGRKKRTQTRGRRPQAKGIKSDKANSAPEAATGSVEEQPPVEFVHQQIDRKDPSIAYGRRRQNKTKAAAAKVNDEKSASNDEKAQKEEVAD